MSHPRQTDGRADELKPWAVWIPLLLFIAVVVLEVAYYPHIEMWIYRVLTGTEGGDGSGLPYVQLVYAAPGGLLFLITFATILWFVVRRRPRLLVPTITVALVVDVALILLSVFSYETAVRS